MKTRKNWILLVVFGVYVGLVWANQPIKDFEPNYPTGYFEKIKQWSEERRATLSSLKGCNVSVFIFPSDEADLEITERELQIEAEIQIRRSGIEVFPRKSLEPSQDRKTLRDPQLEIWISSHRKGTYPRPVADIKIQLRQTVLLARDPTISCYAVTWEWYDIISAKEEDFKDIRVRLKEKFNASLNEFINDYFAANPKQELSERERERGQKADYR